jgi:hypothetical protein
VAIGAIGDLGALSGMTTGASIGCVFLSPVPQRQPADLAAHCIARIFLQSLRLRTNWTKLFSSISPDFHTQGHFPAKLPKHHSEFTEKRISVVTLHVASSPTCVRRHRRQNCHLLYLGQIRAWWRKKRPEARTII